MSIGILAALVATPAAARQSADGGAQAPYEVGGQITAIWQNLFRFRSPYAGPNSLQSRNEAEVTDTYTLDVGGRVSRNLEAYVDPEASLGRGIGSVLGVAGFTNGDAIRVTSLGYAPYLARCFLRWTVPTARGGEHVDQGENQVAGVRPARRVVITMGRLAATDIFDLNSYSNSTRTQFMNWALINNGAWDYAADTRGYTDGLALEWVHPNWTVRAGSFRLATVANGEQLSGDLIHSRGDNVELEIHPSVIRGKSRAIFRLLAYHNVADMGNYAEALALAQSMGTTPDITRTRRRGTPKYGLGLNYEQALADDGDTGVFGRMGWDDGNTESFMYTEIDRTVSVGCQIAGTRWRRPQDRLGLALVQNDLSGVHKRYLAAGGLGFLLGDGKLDYAPERIMEAYYSRQVDKPVSVAVDYQFIADPGFNRDRGPVSVISVRFHAEY